MPLPEAIRGQLDRITNFINRGIAVPLAEDIRTIRQCAEVDPLSVVPFCEVLVKQLNSGGIDPGSVRAWLDVLSFLARTSDDLRSRIKRLVDVDLLDQYQMGTFGPSEQAAASTLSEALSIELPKNYYDLARKVRVANGSLMVIGAGFSYDSAAPLGEELEMIASITLRNLGVDEPRLFYQSDPEAAWRMLSESWEPFQWNMVELLAKKKPTEQHRIAAQLFHDGDIKHIISLNWDDLIEKAYFELYGEPITKVNSDGPEVDHGLWKIHGDIADRSTRWILPYDDGHVFEPLVRIARESTIPTFVLGYREQEKVVRDNFIDVLANRGGVTRIRPDLPNDPPDQLNDDARSALRKLKAGFDAQS